MRDTTVENLLRVAANLTGRQRAAYVLGLIARLFSRAGLVEFGRTIQDYNLALNNTREELAEYTGLAESFKANCKETAWLARLASDCVS